MRLLLDTHALLWAVLQPEKLPPGAREAIVSPASEVFVSALSLWEISLKASLGKLKLEGCDPDSLLETAMAQSFTFLPLTPQLAASFHRAPRDDFHRDPFDRMLIWQALRQDMTLVTRDGKIRPDKVPGLAVLW